MCFSACASFAVGAVLVPAGIYCLRCAYEYDHRYLLLASFPLLFGLQQILEGMVWLGLSEGDVGPVDRYALGFTFFSHFLWLALVPVTAWVLNADTRRQRPLALFSVLGPLFGASLFLPLVLNDGWLTVSVQGGSIAYLARLIYEDFIPRQAVRLIYALIIVLPLLMVPERRVRVFAGLILASVILTRIFYDQAFVSVWCFFAALLSIYVVHLVHKVRPEESVRHPIQHHGRLHLR